MEDQVIKNPRKQIWRTNKQGNVIRGRNKSTGGRGGFKKGLKENKPGKKSVFDRLGLKTETNKDNNMNTRINFKKNIFQKEKNKDHGFLKKNKSIREQDEFIKGNDSDEYMDDVSEDENSDNMESDGMGSEGVGMEDTELENVGIDDMGSDDVEHDVDSDGIRDAEYDSENMIEELEKEIYNNEERNNHSYKKNSRNDIKPVKEFVGGESVLSNIMQSRRKTNEERRKEEEMRQQYMKKLDELKEERQFEMKRYIKEGFMTDPEKKMDIKDAINLIPDCHTMCPEFERAERKFENNVDKFEKNPYEMVKKYTRSAAGTHIIMPCDVRTPKVLLETTHYLIDKVVNNDKHTFYETHSFVRDRLRAVAKDFILQHYNGPIAVEVYEMISRFYILSIHELSKEKKWDEIPEERKQLKATLSNLVEEYEMLRKKNIQCPNEHEFRSYIDLNNLFMIKSAYNFIQTNNTFKYDMIKKETRIVKKVERLIAKITVSLNISNKQSFNDDILLLFMEFFDFVFNLEKDYFLFGCIIETHFQSVRRLIMLTLKLMNNENNNQISYTVQSLNDLLHFDDLEFFKKFLNYCGINNFNINNGPQEQVILDLNGSSLIDIKKVVESIHILTQVIFSKKVDQIKKDRDYKSIICGLLDDTKDLSQTVSNNNNNNNNNLQGELSGFSFITGKTIPNVIENQNLNSKKNSVILVKEKQKIGMTLEQESIIRTKHEEILQLKNKIQGLIDAKNNLKEYETQLPNQAERYQEYLNLQQVRIQEEALIEKEIRRDNILQQKLDQLNLENREITIIFKEAEQIKAELLEENKAGEIRRKEMKDKLDKEIEKTKRKEIERKEKEKEIKEKRKVDNLAKKLTEEMINEYTENLIKEQFKIKIKEETTVDVLYTNLVENYMQELVYEEMSQQYRSQYLIQKYFKEFKVKAKISSNKRKERERLSELTLKMNPLKMKFQIDELQSDVQVNWNDYIEFKEGMTTDDMLCEVIDKSREVYLSKIKPILNNPVIRELLQCIILPEMLKVYNDQLSWSIYFILPDIEHYSSEYLKTKLNLKPQIINEELYYNNFKQNNINNINKSELDIHLMDDFNKVILFPKVESVNFRTLVFQLDILELDQNKNDYFFQQVKKLEEIILIAKTKEIVFNNLGIIYWPNSTEDLIDQKSIYNEVVLSSELINNTFNKITIKNMDPGDIDEQLQDFLFHIAKQSNIDHPEKLRIYTDTLSNFQQKTNDLITLMTSSTYLANYEHFFKFLDIGFEIFNLIINYLEANDLGQFKKQGDNYYMAEFINQNEEFKNKLEILMENTVNSDEVVNNDLKNNLKDVLNEIAIYLFNSLQVYQTNVPINFQFINPIFEQFVLKKQQQIKDINNNMLENKREHEAIEREIKKPKLDVMKKINHSKKVIKEFKEFLNQIGNKQSTTL